MEGSHRHLSQGMEGTEHRNVGGGGGRSDFHIRKLKASYPREVQCLAIGTFSSGLLVPTNFSKWPIWPFLAWASLEIMIFGCMVFRTSAGNYLSSWTISFIKYCLCTVGLDWKAFQCRTNIQGNEQNETEPPSFSLDIVITLMILTYLDWSRVVCNGAYIYRSHSNDVVAILASMRFFQYTMLS